ncbi:hypothetical protein SEPCBS119000_004996 [Sporothrix epigloea]|uniref:J domain-containing protein n=1 Tax=Sporothrix epigloea TaxID=1892477 RepID=A0ABP0DV68_9PEZI
MYTSPATRQFHSSQRCNQDGALVPSSQNHYETLSVPFGAPVADIKKLSKIHHPDRNPHDPHASRRFMRLSDAYAVLSHAEKRAHYDREVMRHQQQHHHLRGQHRPNASYHSTGPAGGRPASGLSRRRSAFRGPPPSFYRNSGTGKGTAYQPDENAPHSSQQQYSSRTGASGGPHHGPSGFGPGNVNANDAGTRSSPETPHFDWERTERSHRNVNERIAERRAAAAHGASYREETSMVVGFFIMSAAIVAGVVVPVMLFNDWRRASTKTSGKSKLT